jgi:hypothetical protein
MEGSKNYTFVFSKKRKNKDAKNQNFRNRKLVKKIENWSKTFWTNFRLFEPIFDFLNQFLICGPIFNFFINFQLIED